MLDPKRRNKRLVSLFSIFLCLLLVYAGLLAHFQILSRGDYLKQDVSGYTSNIVIPAPRGQIVDCMGRPLATNRQGNDIVLNAAYLPDVQINSTIIALAQLLSAEKEGWTDRLPMDTAAPYGFLTDAGAQNLAVLKTTIKVQQYATAENCFAQMVKSYKLEQYAPAQQRLLMGVRYSMQLADYSSYQPLFTLAEDVSFATVSKIKESSFAFPGVEVQVVPIRQYNAPDIAPQVVGTLRPLYAEDVDALVTNGDYRMNAKIGASGIEQAMESYLRGQDGKEQIQYDDKGNVIGATVVRPMVPGGTVVLTLDSNLQSAAQNALAGVIAGARKTNPQVGGAAAVMVNVHTGAVLACATYPTYSMDTYAKDYASLSKDPGKPLFNRALLGRYPPGSTMKPGVAAIGLQTGIITPDTVVYSTGVYTVGTGDTAMKFKDLEPPGAYDVLRAIKVSCNYFFYWTAARVGISRLNEYWQKFGFGQHTGVEIGDDSGIMAGPAERTAAGGNWYDGDTVQAGIGQSDSAITPIQMAIYASTIANGGIRYKAHFVGRVLSYNQDKLLQPEQVRPLNITGISAENYDVVKQGMAEVAQDGGTASAVFRGYPIKIGGKTGTAQVAGKQDNGVFIAFAPYQNPEIAVSVVVEQGGFGATVAAPIAKDILDAYFKPQVTAELPLSAGELLK